MFVCVVITLIQRGEVTVGESRLVRPHELVRGRQEGDARAEGDCLVVLVLAGRRLFTTMWSASASSSAAGLPAMRGTMLRGLWRLGSLWQRGSAELGGVFAKIRRGVVRAGGLRLGLVRAGCWST